MTKEENPMEHESGWKRFDSNVRKSVILSNLAYAETEEELRELAGDIPAGYQIILMTDHVHDTREASFRCVAFINEENKEIIFATAGTRPGLHKKGLDDLYDDFLLMLEYKPAKMKPAQELNQMILDSLGEEARNYQFHYTGHSLGAAMAEMQAADMHIKLKRQSLESQVNTNQITAVTFENPGTRTVIEKMYEEAGLPLSCVKEPKFYEFNNRENVINTLNNQVGTLYTIIPDTQSERNPNYAQMIFEFIAKHVTKLSPFLGKIFKLLAPGGIGMELASDHSISRFNEVFVQKAGRIKTLVGEIIPMQEAYSVIKPIKHDFQLATRIQDFQQSKGTVDKPELSMDRFDQATMTLERTAFSRRELASVMEQEKQASRTIKEPKLTLAQQIIAAKRSSHTELQTAEQVLANKQARHR